MHNMRILGALLVTVALGRASEPSLVISQVYINDWYGAQYYQSHYAELFNRGTKDVTG